MEFLSIFNEQQKYNNQNCEAPNRNPQNFLIMKSQPCGENFRYICYQCPLNGLPTETSKTPGVLKIASCISESK